MGQVQSVLEGWPDYFAGKTRPGWSGRYVGVKGGFLAALGGSRGRSRTESDAVHADADADAFGSDEPYPSGDDTGGDGAPEEAMCAEDEAEASLPLSRMFAVAGVSCFGFWVSTVVATKLAEAADSRFGRLSPATRRRFPLYVNSLLHAGLSAGFALHKLVRQRHTRGNRQLIAMMLGYFVNDLIRTRKDWVSHPADLWHHLMGISITSAAMAIPRIAPFIPMFVVVELSTIFLNLMWLLRTAGRADTAMYKACQALFVSLFMLLRVVWLPIATAHMVLRERKNFIHLGKIRLVFFPINVLQFYWAFKIIQMVRSTKSV